MVAFPRRPMPALVPVRQELPTDRVQDVEAAVREAIEAQDAIRTLKPGGRVAITAGSRGIADIDKVLRAVVTRLREAGAEPFIVPAMGSHGGATASGQTEVLQHYGVSE